jgi:PAS domain S-box-containing protein
MPDTLFPLADEAARTRLSQDEMVRLTNTFDWSLTELGPMSAWPESLRTTVRIMLASDVPMVLIAGQKSGVLIYNSGYADFAGSRHPVIFGQPVLEAWPEIADFNAENMRRGFSGESWYLPDQELVLNRTGSLQSAWMNLNYSPVMDGAGDVLGVLVIVVETTARYLAERELQESREKLDLALSASGLVGTWDWDIAGDVVTADERFARLFGLSAGSAAVGVPVGQFIDAIHPEDRDRVWGEITAAIASPGPVRFEYRLLRPDGEVRWVVASGRAIADDAGQPLRLPGVVVDVTDERLIAERLVESEMRFRTLADTMPQMVWSTLPDGFHDYYNARWYEFTGVPEGSTDGEGWNGMFHPDDQDLARKVWQHSLDTGEPYNIEYRLRHHSGDYRWVLGQALPIRDAAGNIVRWFGTCTDIHENRLAQEEREVIAQELSHRIKNIFAVIGGIVALAARTYPEAAGLATELRARIISLGKAHDFVRPHSRASASDNNPGSLRQLVTELMSPYRLSGAERIEVVGDDAAIDEGAATPLALIFHELATNAAKYGALANPAGRVRIAFATEGDNVRVVWREIGGAAGPLSDKQGFGSRLMALSVEGQLRGTMTRRWEPDGLVAELLLPLASLSRKATIHT